MPASQAFNQQRVSLTGWTCRIFAIALLSTAMAANQAAAGQRGATAVGAGIAGAILLNELAKGTGKRKVTKQKRSKSGVASRPSKPSKKQAQDKKQDAPSSKAQKETNSPSDAIETGSTAATLPVKAAPPQGGGALITSTDEIKAAQQHLRFMGYDIPQENGTLDPKTKSAVMQFQDSIGAPVTGDLTTDQLQMLFLKVAGTREGS